MTLKTCSVNVCILKGLMHKMDPHSQPPPSIPALAVDRNLVEKLFCM